MNAKGPVFGVLRFHAEKVKEVLRHLKKLVDETYKNVGCVAYDIAEAKGANLH